MNQGKTVEYIDQGKFVCALCLEDRGGKLHVLTPSNREANLSPKRVLLVSKKPLIDPSRPREQMLTCLRQAEERRNRLTDEVHVRELWELIHDENEAFDYDYLAELSFDEVVDDDHISALVRALFEDKLHFKLKDGRFQPNTRQRIEEILRQQAEERRRERVLSQGSEWLRKALDGERPAMPACVQEVIRLVSDLALYGDDAPEYKQARELLSRTGHSDPRSARHILVSLGIWGKDQDLDLLRLQIRTAFSDALIAHAQQLKAIPADMDSREDLRHLDAMTIDGPATRDFDDALSLEERDGALEVGVHIADVAGIIEPESLLDLEARQRGASLYLPRQHIPMIPPTLSQDTLSLKQDCDRPAISLLCRMDPEGGVLSYRFVPSLIRVKRQVTYDEVNEQLEKDASFQRMHRLAMALQRQRIEQGALVLSVPEVSIRVDDDGTVSLRMLEQDTPSRMLVAEFMILYNGLAARFCRDRRIPILYRGQGEPSDRLTAGDMDPLFYVFMQRRKLQPMMIDTDPSPHAGLGLEAYTNITSPIRRYLDLAVQRQIRNALLGRPLLYDGEAMDKIRMAVQASLKDLATVRRNRTRYWIQKYLHQNRGLRMDALILWSTRSKHRLLITDVLLVTEMKRKNGRDFSPGQRIRVAVEKSDPWEDELNLVPVEEVEGEGVEA